MTDWGRLLEGAERVVAKAAAKLVEMQHRPLRTARKVRDIVTDADVVLGLVHAPAVDGADSGVDDLVKIASNGRIHDELLGHLCEALR